MTKVTTRLALLLLLACPSASRGQDAALTARVDSIFAAYDNTRSPGCALGVIRDSDLVLARGYGMADLEHGIALAPTSVFRIGSTSKQFTAAAMVLLAQGGAVPRRRDPVLPAGGPSLRASRDHPASAHPHERSARLPHADGVGGQARR